MLLPNQKECNKKFADYYNLRNPTFLFNVVFHPEAANEHTSLQTQRRCIQSSRNHAGGKADGSRHPSDRHGQVDDSLQARGATSTQTLSMAIAK